MINLISGDIEQYGFLKKHTVLEEDKNIEKIFVLFKDMKFILFNLDSKKEKILNTFNVSYLSEALKQIKEKTGKVFDLKMLKVSFIKGLIFNKKNIFILCLYNIFLKSNFLFLIDFEENKEIRVQSFTPFFFLKDNIYDFIVKKQKFYIENIEKEVKNTYIIYGDSGNKGEIANSSLKGIQVLITEEDKKVNSIISPDFSKIISDLELPSLNFWNKKYEFFQTLPQGSKKFKTQFSKGLGVVEFDTE